MNASALRLPLVLAWLFAPALTRADEPIRFGLDVLPILSANCFACHGPDEHERKAKLRLDQGANAKAEHSDGFPIVSGKPEESVLVDRIESTDPDEIMPPPKSNKHLKPEERAILRSWIAQGAKWGRHWSFEPLRRPTPPMAARDSGAIDAFVDAALAAKGLVASLPASPQTLVRRLSLDLIGLPPTPEAADAFARDPTEAAYERLVDELLARPQFGEHWARMWLDLARYADTKGYEKDLGRTMWPYRDWVVEAFNRDLPLDQFTVKQLAGDLAPGATQEDLIATAFHRNTLTNEEGGTDPEEFRVVAVKDRIDTTMQVWMGLTMGCAKCHSHKYDPISQTEYYSFYAIFNQTEDANRGDEAPTLAIASDPAARERLAAEVKSAETAVKSAEKQNLDFDDSSALDAARKALAEAKEALRKFDESTPKLPILRELPSARRRVTKLQRRGNFLDPGEVVEPGVPAGLGDLPAAGVRDRLAVARWLVSPENPLTPRVWANRIWARIFGLGLVETEEDFGALGARPVNPALLDWLAAEYRDQGWSLKKLLKTVVLSRAYRRDSAITPAALTGDPRDLYLERAPRFRITAEAVRDQALAVGGLLSLKMGGPPVMPPQPSGLWRSTYSGQKWVDAEGENRWRRGLYTYWKRTTPYPSMIAFDAGSREVCQIRRISTNTPLQALVTLNDPVYLEAAAALARRMCAEAAENSARAERGLRLALIRPLHAGEIDPLLALQQDAQAAFAADPPRANALLEQSRWTAEQRATLSEPEAASWLVVASAILNLDEFLSRN